MEKILFNYFKKNEELIFEDLKKLVSLEASTSDIKELAIVRNYLKDLILKRTSLIAQEIKTEGGHDVLKIEYGKGEEIVIVGHYDTVHLIGSFKMYEEDGKLYGPGVYDMKNGLISIIWTLKAFIDLNIELNKKLIIIFNGDEETGSKESTKIIAENAKNSKAALILEPGTAKGNLKTGRKGILHFEIEIIGKAAHAGNNYFDGINAIEEMAHIILYLQNLTDSNKGTTVNVGVCKGGNKVNVVADQAMIEVDCRYKTIEERERLIEEINNIKPTLKGIKVNIKLSAGKMPMIESKENLKLFEIARKCANNLCFDIGHEFVGGGSDGNELSSLGIPVLDGLGAIGDNAHSKNEHIVINEYINRISLLACLIEKI